MTTLTELCAKYKVGDWPDRDSTHSYLPVYEEILAPYRTTAKNILEIGLLGGESLKMWSDYFTGKVYGIDCDIRPVGGLADLTKAIAEGYRISIGDATSKADINKFYKGKKWDVVFDDGNHQLSSQLQTFEIFKTRMNKGGLIVIEDIQAIDETGDIFLNLGHDIDKVEIVDLRHIKNRYDDVLVLFYF